MNKSIKEKICHICGKTFIPAVYHQYKSQGRLVCSYSCVLKGERADEMKDIKELAKELCDKSSCHRKCHDTDHCIVEDEAKEVIANSATTTEKQIEEMAEMILDFVHTKHNQLSMRDIAETLYNAGYRKQSEGEWVKINPNNLLIGEYYCSCCNSVIDIADGRETPLDREMYYCPNCGARMSGGKK